MKYAIYHTITNEDKSYTKQYTGSEFIL